MIRINTIHNSYHVSFELYSFFCFFLSGAFILVFLNIRLCVVTQRKVALYFKDRLRIS